MGTVGDDFYTAVLRSLGAPVTPNTLQLCRDWQRFEGGSASWNPWNTTSWAPGATDYNSAHVRNYPDEATGISATVSTLRNGYYPDVVVALQSDRPEDTWGEDAAIIGQINIWGTHGFAAYLQTLHPTPPPPPSPQTNGHLLGARKTMLILNVTPDGGEWLLSGNLCIHLEQPTSVSSLLAAGVPAAQITQDELDVILAVANK